MEALGTARTAQGQKIRAVEQLLRRVREALGRAPGAEARVRRRFAAELGKISKFCKFLAGSFSAIIKRNFARKYAFDSISQVLQDLHPFAPLESQNFRKKIGLKKQQIS